MEFILESNMFDNILSAFLIINTIVVLIFSFKEIKHKEYDEEKNKIINKKIYTFKIATITLWILIFMILIAYLCFKYHFISYISLAYYLYFILLAYRIRKKNISEFTYENKSYFNMITFVYLLFFSSGATSVYIKTFSMMSHIVKEYMLVGFLIIKLVFFIFCAIMNISILIASIKSIFKKQLSNIINKTKKYINKTFEFKFYNLNLSNNGMNKKMLILDIPIYIIICPISIIVNLVGMAIIIASKWVLKRLLVLGKCISRYLDNSSKIISKIIKVSIIVSLIIVYGILLYNEGIIDEKTRDIYNLIITVVLIPLIYDRIKEK